MAAHRPQTPPVSQIADSFWYDDLDDEAHMDACLKLDDYNAHKAKVIVFAHSTIPNGGEKVAWATAYHRSHYSLVLEWYPRLIDDLSQGQFVTILDAEGYAVQPDAIVISGVPDMDSVIRLTEHVRETQILHVSMKEKTTFNRDGRMHHGQILVLRDWEIYGGVRYPPVEVQADVPQEGETEGLISEWVWPREPDEPPEYSDDVESDESDDLF